MTITFIEAKPFTLRIKSLGADEELEALKKELVESPEKGEVIPGTGGLRKVRMRLPGRGKSGGARVLYIFLQVNYTIFFIFVYPKNEMENISAADKKRFKEVIDVIKENYNKK